MDHSRNGNMWAQALSAIVALFGAMLLASPAWAADNGTGGPLVLGSGELTSEKVQTALGQNATVDGAGNIAINGNAGTSSGSVTLSGTGSVSINSGTFTVASGGSVVVTGSSTNVTLNLESNTKVIGSDGTTTVMVNGGATLNVVGAGSVEAYTGTTGGTISVSGDNSVLNIGTSDGKAGVVKSVSSGTGIVANGGTVNVYGSSTVDSNDQGATGIDVKNGAALGVYGGDIGGTTSISNSGRTTVGEDGEETTIDVGTVSNQASNGVMYVNGGDVTGNFTNNNAAAQGATLTIGGSASVTGTVTNSAGGTTLIEGESSVSGEVKASSGSVNTSFIKFKPRTALSRNMERFRRSLRLSIYAKSA